MEKILSAGKTRFLQVFEKAEQKLFVRQYITLTPEILQPRLDIDDCLFWYSYYCLGFFYR